MIDYRIKGMPITFLAVLALTVLLTIFFGAWAVSADDQTENRGFAFAIGGAPALGTNSSGSPQGEASTDVASEDASDTWWGGTFLKACPFH